MKLAVKFPALSVLHTAFILVFKSSLGFAVSSVANFGFCLAPYSSVCKFRVSISFSPAADFVFLKKTLSCFIAQPYFPPFYFTRRE